MSETHRPRWIDVTVVDGLPEFEPCCAVLGCCRDCGRVDHLTQAPDDGGWYCCCCLAGGRRYCDHSGAGQ